LSLYRSVGLSLTLVDCLTLVSLWQIRMIAIKKYVLGSGISVLLLPSAETLDKLLNFSEAHFSHL
jgi:hypothetical protein